MKNTENSNKVKLINKGLVNVANQLKFGTRVCVNSSHNNTSMQSFNFLRKKFLNAVKYKDPLKIAALYLSHTIIIKRNNFKKIKPN